VPNTDAHVRVGDWLVQVLRKNADRVIEQPFTHVTMQQETLRLRNIFAQFNPDATTRVLYLSHWDSRPHADQSFAIDDRNRPVPGANDGASSTALLLVLAEALKAQPTAIGVDLLFTDGEDYGDFGPPMVDVLLGAQYFVDHPLPDSAYRPTFAVLWDMIGDRDLRIQIEPNSRRYAQDVVDRVWKIARDMGYEQYFPDQQYGYPITDDHVPFGDRGYRIIDVIDLEFPWHHTTGDTIDKVSAQSLEIVGRVALALIRQTERQASQ
jgi:glutaminyl-peptide cyclotransferase